MPKTTKAQLEEQVRQLKPFEEYFWITRNPRKYSKHILKEKTGLGTLSVTLLGPERPSGGVVVDGPSCYFAEKWAISVLENSDDCHSRNLANQVLGKIREVW